MILSHCGLPPAVSDPPDAEVRANGERQGRTPLRLGHFDVGETVIVTVTIPGRPPVTQRLVVEEGEGPQVLRVVGR